MIDVKLVATPQASLVLSKRTRRHAIITKERYKNKIKRMKEEKILQSNIKRDSKRMKT